MHLKKTARIIVALSVVVLGGCSTVSYYSQAIGGQWALSRNQRSIQGLIENPGTSGELRSALINVEEIRAFARRELALPVGNTFASYKDLERDSAIWNLIAAPVDSLELKTWCYPLIGCQSYRGYFQQEAAMTAGQRLAQEGWDTWVVGIDAYSTLGWFDDPVLNTFIHWREDQLAGLLFHELSHKIVYLEGDTTFNESYATAVELEGLIRYLEQRGQTAAFNPTLSRLRMEQEFTGLVMDAAGELRALYRQPGLSDAIVLTRKEAILDQLRADYGELSRDWPIPGAYQTFFDEGLNNARIASVGTYHRWVDAFRQLLREHNGNFERFHKAVRALSELPREARTERLEELQRPSLNRPPPPSPEHASRPAVL